MAKNEIGTRFYIIFLNIWHLFWPWVRVNIEVQIQYWFWKCGKIWSQISLCALVGIGPFLDNTETRGRTDNKLAFSWCKKCITPSIYETIHQKVFTYPKFWPEILTIMKVLAKTTRGPFHLHTAGSDTIFIQIYMDTPPRVQGVSKIRFFFRQGHLLTPLGSLGVDPYRRYQGFSICF